jgi:zinc protease
VDTRKEVLRTVLPNGLRVLVRRDDTAPVAAVVTRVKAGYFDETDDVVGIAHVLEHMYFKGTPTRGVGEIAKQTKASGGYLNASTIYDNTTYYAVLPASGFDAGLAIQADAYANSLIDADELSRELEVIIEEAKRKADTPWAVTVETLHELLHDRHRIRRWRIGREEGLRRLRRDDLLRFYRNFYRPTNTILTIVGDVDLDRTMRQVERLYGALPDGAIERAPGEQETALPGFRYRELTGDLTQTQVSLGWRTPGTLHPDTPLLDLAATILGVGRASRLYRAVRERRLASGVGAYDYTPTEIGVFVVHTDGDPDTAPEALRATWREVRSLHRHGVGESELVRAQRIFESRWLRRLESMDGQAHHLAEWEALGDWKLGDEAYERTMRATVAEVNDAVGRHLDLDQVGMIVHRPSKHQVFADGEASAHAMLDAVDDVVVAPPPALAAPSAPAVVSYPALELEHGLVRVYRTRHDVPVLVQRRPGAPITHLGLYALGGALSESTEHAGIAILTTRAALKGTATRSAATIAEEAELLGGSISPSVTHDVMGWALSVPRPRLAAALDLLSDVTQRPTLSAEAVETERTIALTHLAQLRDDMYRYPMRLTQQAAFGDHPYGRGALGTEPALRAVDADDVRAWHERHVLQSPAMLAVVGDVDPDDAAAALATAFGEMRTAGAPQHAPPVWPSAATERVEQRDKTQTAIALAFPGPDRRDPRRHAARLVADVASGLGGRFFEELRERQSLAYTVHAHTAERRQAGAFITYIATSPEKESAARSGLLREFERLRESLVTEEELSRAQVFAIGTRAIALQSGGYVMSELVDAWLLGEGLHELDAFDERVRGVTREAVQSVARTFFDPAVRVEGIVRGTGRAV